MNEPQVEFVEPKGFTINLPTVGAPVTIRTQGDEIVILVRLTLRPRDNVVNIDLDVSAGGNSTAMTRLNEDASSDVSRYWKPVVHNTECEEMG